MTSTSAPSKTTSTDIKGPPVEPSIEGDTEALMKGSGACIVLHTPNVPKWLKVFEEFYYNVDNRGDNDTNCDWMSGPPITTIKYNTTSTNISLTITIWHSTGTINMQGPRPSLDIALFDHYLTLAAIRTRGTQ